MTRLFEKAINEGIHQGFEDALSGACDGYDEPQERCPMRPRDGCACLRVRWRKLPWWKRIFTKEPMRTDQDAVLETLFRQKIDDMICSALADVKKRTVLGENE
jgi:hypothetical protein